MLQPLFPRLRRRDSPLRISADSAFGKIPVKPPGKCLTVTRKSSAGSVTVGVYSSRAARIFPELRSGRSIFTCAMNRTKCCLCGERAVKFNVVRTCTGMRNICHVAENRRCTSQCQCRYMPCSRSGRRAASMPEARRARLIQPNGGGGGSSPGRWIGHSICDETNAPGSSNSAHDEDPILNANEAPGKLDPAIGEILRPALSRNRFRLAAFRSEILRSGRLQ